MIPKEKAFSKLESVNDRLLIVPSKFYAATLCELLDEIERQKFTELLDAHALSEFNQDAGPVLAVKQQLLNNLRSNNEKIEHYYQEHSLTMPECFIGPRGISEFRAYDSGQIKSRAFEEGKMGLEDTLLYALRDAISRSLRNLMYPKTLSSPHIDFVLQLAHLDESGNIIALKIAPFIDLWHSEKTDFERRQTASFWYAWNKLKEFHMHYKNHESKKNKARVNKEYLLEADLHNEFEKLNLPDAIDELKMCQQRIFCNLEQIIIAPIEPTTVIEKIPIHTNVNRLDRYASETGTLLIGTYKINFPHKKSIAHTILPIFTKDMTNRRKKWSWDEIYEETQNGQEPPKNPGRIEKYKRKLYDGYNHINEQALKQSKDTLKDFLIVGMNECYINPIYL